MTGGKLGQLFVVEDSSAGFTKAMNLSLSCEHQIDDLPSNDGERQMLSFVSLSLNAMLTTAMVS